MEKERRKHDRCTIERQLEGELSLLVNGHSIGILRLHDVSLFGIGLLIEGYIADGCEVHLRYRYKTADIKVSGLVNWSSPADPDSDKQTGAWIVGIYLQEDEVIQNVDFFNAITV